MHNKETYTRIYTRIYTHIDLRVYAKYNVRQYKTTVYMRSSRISDLHCSYAALLGGPLGRWSTILVLLWECELEYEEL